MIECNNSDIPEEFAFPPIVKSLAEDLAEKLPNASVVKAFNTISQELFELAPDPLRNYGVSVFVAGDDERARKTVMSLAEEIGFAPVDCGALRNSRMIERVGDFIRFLMIGQNLGFYATISVNTLPAPQEQRLGGRQPSSLK